MEAASPDLEKQGFFAVVFVNREYSVQPDLVEKSGIKYSFLNEGTPKLQSKTVLDTFFASFHYAKNTQTDVLKLTRNIIINCIYTPNTAAFVP